MKTIQQSAREHQTRTDLRSVSCIWFGHQQLIRNLLQGRTTLQTNASRLIFGFQRAKKQVGSTLVRTPRPVQPVTRAATMTGAIRTRSYHSFNPRRSETLHVPTKTGKGRRDRLFICLFSPLHVVAKPLFRVSEFSGALRR